MPKSVSQPNTAQTRFDSVYISSGDICKLMNISRPSLLHARRRGLLPDPIVVNEGHLYLWERETVQQYLDAWKLILQVRRTA